MGFLPWQLRKLRDLAKEGNISRSEVVRRLVSAGLAEGVGSPKPQMVNELYRKALDLNDQAKDLAEAMTALAGVLKDLVDADAASWPDEIPEESGAEQFPPRPTITRFPPAHVAPGPEGHPDDPHYKGKP